MQYCHSGNQVLVESIMLHYNFSLQNYRQNNVVLRIGVYSPYGDTYLLDDITIGDSTGFTGVEDLAGITPSDFELSQNYPNPFQSKYNNSICVTE